VRCGKKGDLKSSKLRIALDNKERHAAPDFEIAIKQNSGNGKVSGERDGKTFVINVSIATTKSTQ